MPILKENISALANELANHKAITRELKQVSDAFVSQQAQFDLLADTDGDGEPNVTPETHTAAQEAAFSAKLEALKPKFLASHNALVAIYTATDPV